MATPEKMEVASSGAKEEEAGAGPVPMDTDDKGVAAPGKGKDETAAGKKTKRDEAGDLAAGEKPSSKAPSGSDEAATGDGDKAGGADGGKKPKIEMIKDQLPEIDIVMCFGRCQDCTLKACKKIRSKNTKTDLLLCQECLDLHLHMEIDGEEKLNINLKENQEDSEEYPREKRVAWECKNRPNYTPAQREKYVKEKYAKRVAFDELDKPVEELKTKFEYQLVHSDGLTGGRGTIELSIPDLPKPTAKKAADGDDKKPDSSAEGGDSDETKATVDDKTSSAGGDSGKADATTEGGDSGKSDATAEGGDSGKSDATAEGADSGKSDATAEGGESSKSVATTEGGESGKSDATVEGGESGKSDATAEDVDIEMTDADTEGVSTKTETAVEGGDTEMTDATVEGDKTKEDTSSTKAEKPKGSITIEGEGLGKTTYDADVIRFIALANNGSDFFVQLCIELGEWDIKNYFFSLKDDTTLFQLVNNARRMMYTVRYEEGEHDYSCDFLNYMEPINRLCKVKVTKIKKTEDDKEHDKKIDDGTENIIWIKTYFASLDPEYLWLKETLHEKDKALLLAYYNHDDKEKDIIDEVKLRYKRSEKWITTHIFTTNGFEYKMEATQKNDKDYHLLKSKMTRSPIDQGVLKDIPKFVDKVKYLMEIMHPVTFGIPKERDERLKRIWQRDHPGKTFQDAEEEDLQNEAEEVRKWRERRGMPPQSFNDILEDIKMKSAQVKKDAEQRMAATSRGEVHVGDTPGPVVTAFDSSLAPSEEEMKKKWEDLCKVFKAKENFVYNVFDATGLDPDSREGFDQCVSEVQTNFEIGEFDTVIDQAGSILEYYKKTKNSKIRRLVSERKLLKFIYSLVITLPNEPKMHQTIDTKDVPELAPKDEELKKTWELLRNTFNKKTNFPTNALSGKEVNVNSDDSYQGYVTEVQTSFTTYEFGKAIDLAHAMLKVFFDSDNPAIKAKVAETSLLKFIYATIFGADALPGAAGVGVAGVGMAGVGVPAVVKPRIVDVSDVPGLEPDDEGMKEMWNKFREAFVARTDFPTDALKEMELNPNSRADFDSLVDDKVRTGFFTLDYDGVIDAARAMMEIYQHSTDEPIQAATSESSLLKFIYELVFKWGSAETFQ